MRTEINFTFYSNWCCPRAFIHAVLIVSDKHFLDGRFDRILLLLFFLRRMQVRLGFVFEKLMWKASFRVNRPTVISVILSCCKCNHLLLSYKLRIVCVIWLWQTSDVARTTYNQLHLGLRFHRPHMWLWSIQFQIPVLSV